MASISPAMAALYQGDVNADDLLPEQPDVFEAAGFGRIERLRQILAEDRQAATARAADDFTPLHLAAFFGHPEAVEALLEAGADVNSQASNSFVGRVQPLHSAVANQDSECAQLLLAAGADANAQQADGFTPLMEAAQAGDAQLTKILLTGGADPAIQRPDGTDAASLARSGGHAAVLELLASRHERS